METAPREIRQDIAGETRELWGRRFPIVGRGLDVPPVVRFVEELIRRYQTLAKELEDAKFSFKSLMEVNYILDKVYKNFFTKESKK